MRCSKCGSDNREGRKFCTNCGTSLPASCPKCGAAIQPDEKFCGECGAGLAEVAGPKSPEVTPITASADGERRHLTILFCDLVGSTEIASRLDPEEWRELAASYHRAAADAITRFGGHVAKYLGDGVMAFFGYPEAHENDAERAVRAGLQLLDSLARLNETSSHDPRLAARIGIDSGAVVVGASAGKDADVFGDTPNIAARVQAAAEHGTVVITDATHRLVSGLFVVDQLGAQALKGIERPVQLYRVIQSSGVRGRLEAAAATRGLTPFVGREDELRLLMSRWERALGGEGQVALIIGEAGIGKSRLLQRFHEQIGGTAHTWIEAGAGAFFQNTPFYPVTEVLQQFLGGNGDKSAEAQLAQLEPRLELAGLKPAETIPLIAALLNLPLSDKYPPLPLSPEQQRRRLLATLVEWVLGAARVQPLIVVTEDLHWADASTLELLQLLVEQGNTAPLLLLFTARPEFHPAWALRTHHAQLNLNRLGTRDIRAMVTQVAAQKALTDETISAVIERTGGVPLFVEELTRAVLESGTGKLAGREIPVTLHDSLMARLDKLGLARETLQTGAVLGSEFSYELLEAVHQLDDVELQRRLRTLTDAELLYVRGIAPEATYQFKHALIRDAAYEALLKSRRKELHRVIAHTINEKFPAIKQAHPEVLARHWSAAGETEHAIAEWTRAGKAAESRNAFKESLEGYQQAVSLVALLPESHERDLREFELRQSIYTMLYVGRGLAAPEAIEAIERVSALAEKTGSLVEYASYLSSRGFSAFFAGDLSAASMFADQILALGVREGSPTMLAHAHFLGFVTCYMAGDLQGAEKRFTTGSTFFSDPGFRQSPGTAVAAIAGAAWTAWALGRFDVARRRESEMMVTVNANSPYEVATAQIYAASLRILLREYARAAALAARALELSEKHQLGYPIQYSRCLLGQAWSQLGRTSDGITLLREGIAGSIGIGLRLRIGYFTTAIAAAQEWEGNFVSALETVDEAARTNTDELFYRPETFRLRGEIRVKLNQIELAEADFGEAIALAQKMQAKAWELRSTMSLTRLLDRQGRRDEAHSMLTEIYNWFTEGFDTADLKDAKALLEELAT
jgi:class 3 adenylate cyclase/tetratricopeptide (TPR) repeat protein